MAPRDLAISVRGLGKSYTIRHQHESHITLAEQALSRLRHPLRRPEREAFWALDDVNFDVRHGEVLGIIGRNGAGKSTLLKVLSRITAPTKGEVRLYGRIGSLLEVGTGFHPELTGRENVYLNGSILGMKTKEIDAQFDAIVDFAGVEKFLDTPVKRYSSGMYVRLAFAVAAHLETEILLLDEVLAVGDIEFQKKCLGKMGQLARGGRAVILVTHNMGSLQSLATSAMYLQSGRVREVGDVETAVAAYNEHGFARDGYVSDSQRWDPTLPRAIEVLRVLPAEGRQVFGADDDIEFDLEVVAHQATPFRVSLTINAGSGAPVGTSFSSEIMSGPAGTTHSVRVHIPSPQLAAGRYDISLSVGRGNERVGNVNFDVVGDVFAFEVAPAFTPDGIAPIWPSVWGPIRLEEIRIKTVDPWHEPPTTRGDVDD